MDFEPLVSVVIPFSNGASSCPFSLFLKKNMLIQMGSFQNEFSDPYQLYEKQVFLTKIFLEEFFYLSSNGNNSSRQKIGSLIQLVKAVGIYKAVRRFYLGWLAKYLQEKKIHNQKIDASIEKAWFALKGPFLFFIARNYQQRYRSKSTTSLKDNFIQ
ncbi:MAG: hypothetical protein NVS1B13_13900 [Flavisolibacter sp.]